MSVKTYDPKCYDLAKTFLEDVSIQEHSAIDELAKRIQGTIEDFIDDSGWYEVIP